MASVREPLAGFRSDDGAVSIQRATPDQQRMALSVLLTGKPRPDDPAVDPFLIFVTQQKMSLRELWLVYRNSRPVAAALLIPSPGRTAILFMSPTVSNITGDTESQLIRQACASQDRHNCRLIQAILDPGQELEQRSLTNAGFKSLAQLIYMQRSAEGGSAELQVEPGIEVRHWGPFSQKRFAAAILASYEQTLDCPGLLGVRSIEDIIAGHMSSGQFVPELWLALYQSNQPVGVMLINPTPQRRWAELVYLGLSPAWRGKGLGRRLLEHGLFLASQHHAATLTLAVDDRNTPAVRLYQAMGFQPTARKIAMILPLPPA